MNVLAVEDLTQSSAGQKSYREILWLPFALVLCFAYGLLLIALIHTTADGSWFWYASALRSGQHLYRDLHLPLQPMYPIELVILQRIFGVSWIAQQAVGLANLILFLCALAFVVRRLELVAWQRALLLCCSFVTCMAFIMMRFDDFHIVATSIELLCAGLLLRLGSRPSPGRRAKTYVALGLLCGACMLVRINDGTLLLCAVLFILAFVEGSGLNRLYGLLAVPVTAAGVMLLVTVAIGETPRDWWFYSIHTAAAIKGGSGHLWQYPFRLPLGTLREFTRDWRTLALTAYTLVLGTGAWLLASRKLPGPSRALIVAVMVLPAIPLARNISRGNAARVLVALIILAIYVAAVLVLARLYARLRGRQDSDWRPAELILLIPLAQLVSVSLSAARWYPNTNPPAAIMLVLLPLGLPWMFQRKGARAALFSLVALLTVSAGIDKLRNPFDWFNYRARSLTAPRVWFQHPEFGPMLIEREQLQLMQPVCAAVSGTSTGKHELLALPFTYPNYFCNIPPWHGYVQTFYDLSGRETISSLESALQSGPPEWIVYQRQLDVLRRNEEAFNDGRPLPHRELDELIMSKLNAGQWTSKRLQSPAGDTSAWLLIHTHPGT